MRLLAFAKTLLGLGFGLPLGFLFVAVTLVLGLAAGFGGLAVGAFGGFADSAALSLFLGTTTLFDFAHLGIGQRAGAGGTFVLGQRAQHHAGAGVCAAEPRVQEQAPARPARASPLRPPAARGCRRHGACRASRPRPACYGHG
ncbi:putative lipid-binding transport protein (Tim44 family) [Bradyrhizobium sp. LB7.1]